MAQDRLAEANAALVPAIRRGADAGGGAPKRRVDAASQNGSAADPCLDTPVSGATGAGGYTKRGMLVAGLALAAAPTFAGINSHAAKKSPDVELLALCARLRDMQAEWQRLYDATSDEDELTTPADFAWQNYSDHVWPLVHSNSFTVPAGVVDYPAQLLTLRATTPEGIQAKATAIDRDRRGSDLLRRTRR
jgi:hypothetical protein